MPDEMARNAGQEAIGMSPEPQDRYVEVQRIVRELRRLCAAADCLREFHPRRSNQRYCSSACRKAAFRERRFHEEQDANLA